MVGESYDSVGFTTFLGLKNAIWGWQQLMSPAFPF